VILDPDSVKPIYLQIAEWLEAEILSENLKDDERVYSQYQLADIFDVNPATAAKGLNLLADENIVYKKIDDCNLYGGSLLSKFIRPILNQMLNWKNNLFLALVFWGLLIILDEFNVEFLN